MPKGKIQSGTSRKTVAVTRKFKIGGRKSTRSATLMSNNELRTIANGKGRGKDVQTARMELERRGADLVIEAPEETVT